MKPVWLMWLAIMLIAGGLCACEAGDGASADGDDPTDGDVSDGCTPRQTTCRGDDVYRCADTGTWQFYVDCVSQGYICREGQCAPQEIPDGDQPDGDQPDGDRPDGDQPDGDRPDGDQPDGDRPDGDQPDGDQPDGDQPDGDQPDGDQPDGDEPDGNEPDGDQPDGDDPERTCTGACNPATEPGWCVNQATYCTCYENTWQELACADAAEYYGYNVGVCGVDPQSSPPEDTCILSYDCTDSAFVNAGCDEGIYNGCTCATADPCDWAQDGYCDDLCQFFADTPFTDTADCNCATMNYAQVCEGAYNSCTCAVSDPCGWLRDGYCDETCHLYPSHLYDGVDCGEIDPPQPGGLGGPCAFGQVNAGAGNCAADLSCVGTHANAASAQPLPCTTNANCAERFGAAGVCAQGYCGVSWCTIACTPGEPGTCAQLNIGNEQACCGTVGTSNMCYIPDLCTQPGTRGPGQTCTFGALYAGVGSCQSGLSCIGVHATASATYPLACASDTFCRGASGFNDPQAVCVNGYCGIAWCAGACTGNGDCTASGYGAPSGCCKAVGENLRCYRESFCD